MSSEAIEIIGIIGTGLVFWSVFLKSIKLLRLMGAIACTVWIYYAYLIGSFPLLVTNVGIAVVHTYRFIQIMKGKDDD